jgi:signal peptidase II
VVVDQVTKWLALDLLDPGDPVPVVWLLQLNLTGNTGAAFSLGADLGPVIAIAAVVVLFLLAWMGRSLQRPASLVAMGAVLGGAISNLADRLFRAADGFMSGAVVDFIDLQKWPIFNVADMGVVLGAIALVLWGATEPDPDAEPTDPEPDPDAEPAPADPAEPDPVDR